MPDCGTHRNKLDTLGIAEPSLMLTISVHADYLVFHDLARDVSTAGLALWTTEAEASGVLTAF